MLFLFLSRIFRNPPSPPTTPEQARQTTRSADRLQRLEMTDPDERRNRNQPLSAIPTQPNFGVLMATTIPEVIVPEDLLPPFDLNAGQPVAGPSHTAVLPPIGVNILDTIPITHIPDGWDRPLSIPIPTNIPQVPVFPRDRGRERGTETGTGNRRGRGREREEKEKKKKGKEEKKLYRYRKQLLCRIKLLH